MTFTISPGSNIRKSPYFEATVADGLAAVSVYNHMYIPAHFGDPEAEYERLIHGVAMWDVAAQRQVEIAGPDAAALVRYLTPRDISKTAVGQGRYVPLCDHDGTLINDPVLLRLAENRFWLSIADSDIELWAKAVAAGHGFDVRVFEPDVSPMAIQGPRAEDLTAGLFGEWVRDLKYFWFRETALDGIPLVLARSGWSKQGGFELYLLDGARGGDLWRAVKRAGAAYMIGPGAPNDIERIESGLLSYGADARHLSFPADPFELGLGKLVSLDRPDDFIGRAALKRIAAEGPARRYLGFRIGGDPFPAFAHQVPIILDGEAVGTICDAAHSPRVGANIGLGLLRATVPDDETGLVIDLDGQSRRVEPAALPFI